MTFHIFRATDQPATRYKVRLDMPSGPEYMTFTNRRLKRLHCHTCKQVRIAWAGKKRGRTTSSGGGGDYAAQMFLGRLRKLGYADTTRDPGSSRWEATPAGRNALAAALALTGAPGEVRHLLCTSRGGGRAVGPRELTADLELGKRGRRVFWRTARPGDRDDGRGR